MGDIKCKKCGTGTPFMIGFCQLCFGYEYRCVICKEPITEYLDVLGIGLRQTKGSKKIENYICHTCKTTAKHF